MYSTLKKSIFAIALCGLILLGGCTQPDGATKHLLDAGYTNVEITGYNFFACSEDDIAHTGFRATGPTGRQVSGTVCGGVFLKGATIRLD